MARVGAPNCNVREMKPKLLHARNSDINRSTLNRDDQQLQPRSPKLHPTRFDVPDPLPVQP